MINIIICKSCGGKGKAIDSLSMMNSDFPLFHYLGHDHYTGYMRYRCTHCNVLLLVDPMEMLGEQYVQGIPCKDKIEIYGDNKNEYYSTGSAYANEHSGMA